METDADGKWQIDLNLNANIKPSNSRWVLVAKDGVDAMERLQEELTTPGTHADLAAWALALPAGRAAVLTEAADRLAAWRESGVTDLLCATSQPEALRVMAELLL